MPHTKASNQIPVTPKMILQARKRLESVIFHTPLNISQALSDIAKCSVSVKWESLQRTGVFKLRGAFNKVASLSSKEPERGVITASTGNHGLAVAFAAKKRGIPATIVVPKDASSLKVGKCKRYGAKVEVHGTNYDEASSHSHQLSKETGATLIHAYADPEVIAGQGTVGYEVLDDLPESDVLLVPVGGGGLISGISIWVKTVNPQIRVIGVQTTTTKAFFENFKAGRLFHVPIEPTIADGLAGNTEQLNLNIAQRYVDDIILVEEEGLGDAIKWTLNNERQVLEPAGAVGIAALLQKKIRLPPNSRIVIIASGSNIDPRLLQNILSH